MRSLHNQHVINSEAESERRAAARDPKNKRNRQMIAAISRERFSATQYRFALAWSFVLPGNQVPSPRPSFSPEDGRIFSACTLSPNRSAFARIHCAPGSPLTTSQDDDAVRTVGT